MAPRGCRVSPRRCWARPGRSSGSWPWIPAAGTAAGPSSPSCWAARWCSAWTGRTGYGAAIAHALRHRAANTNVPGPAGLAPGERTEWVWLLHDDCEPAPDALEQLLRGAAEARSSAVLGPKVMDWADRRVLLEAGITIDGAGRRITGVEPREVDQGQHDGDRDVMAVSSAGMLVRRDVWDQVGGFDPAMPLLRDDVDFCWRVHAAGHRVRVITDAWSTTSRPRPGTGARRPRPRGRAGWTGIMRCSPCWPTCRWDPHCPPWSATWCCPPCAPCSSCSRSARGPRWTSSPG